ncbi:hypothetical protein HGRIS_014380 [Hohenbuehelia grisea]|uniref:Uncharacterized protein n=1 Tax=Hohenbuehelia grisea TaxID=104357 RepID=A0ABR3JTH5_9AGAR
MHQQPPSYLGLARNQITTVDPRSESVTFAQNEQQRNGRASYGPARELGFRRTGPNDERPGIRWITDAEAELANAWLLRWCLGSHPAFYNIPFLRLILARS